MNLERTLRHSNTLLRRELGTSPTALPLFAWGYSEPGVYDFIPDVARFWFLAPEYDIDGNEQYNFNCPCGVNINVHAPDCPGSVATVRLIQHKVAWNVEKSWLLGRWIPAIDRAALESLDHTVYNYDPKGKYVPFRINHIYVACEEPHYDRIPRATEGFITAWKTHEATKSQLLEEMEEKDRLRDWTPPRNPDGTPDIHYQPGGLKGSKHEENHTRIKDSMLFKGKQPGKKDHVSWGSGVDLNAVNFEQLNVNLAGLAKEQALREARSLLYDASNRPLPDSTTLPPKE